MTSRNCLEWIDENQKTHRVQVVDRIFVGRDCVGIDETKRIIVDSPKVSRDHAVIKFDGSCLQIIDMSKNGTWINDVRMAPGSLQDLENDDVIKVADVREFSGISQIPDLVNHYTGWQVFVNNITKLYKTWTLRYINQY